MSRPTPSTLHNTSYGICVLHNWSDNGEKAYFIWPRGVVGKEEDSTVRLVRIFYTPPKTFDTGFDPGWRSIEDCHLSIDREGLRDWNHTSFSLAGLVTVHAKTPSMMRVAQARHIWYSLKSMGWKQLGLGESA